MRVVAVPLSITILAALALGCADGDLTCNTALYIPGVTLRLPALAGDGELHAELVADGTPLSLTWLPHAGPVATVTVQLGETTLHGQAFGDHISIYVEGGQRIPGGPRRLSVAVSQDGAALAAQELTPDYKIEEPNGEGCGKMARALVQLAPA